MCDFLSQILDFQNSCVLGVSMDFRKKSPHAFPGVLERPENTFPPENAGKRRKTPENTKKMLDNS